MNHDKIERNLLRMAIGIAIVISFGGLAQILPLMYQAQVVQPLPGQKPYTPLELAGRAIYIREGCYNCHSQMIRSLRAEVARYGSHSLAAESVYDHPFQWGSKRTGPDLARVGGRYSDEWHRVHLNNPRDVVPESNMPAYPWLNHAVVNWQAVESEIKALRLLGVPYSDEDQAKAAETATATEQQALIAYLQGLGRWVPREPALAQLEPASPAAAAAVPAPVTEPVAADPVVDPAATENSAATGDTAATGESADAAADDGTDGADEASETAPTENAEGAQP